MIYVLVACCRLQPSLSVVVNEHHWPIQVLQEYKLLLWMFNVHAYITTQQDHSYAHTVPIKLESHFLS